MSFIIIAVLIVVLLYFLSTAHTYKTMYFKIKEEKSLTEEEVLKLEALIKRYEKQVKIGTKSLQNNQENLHIARDDLQKLRMENITLKNRINDLQRRNEELFAQVNAII
ncbi:MULTISPECIES: hypothetical protein [Arcobacteraceae]|uniref:Uncharacterized protein n=2 Tax=Aliarcobacter skirrowii TaxID=28200 RepID=A0A2U2C1X2_9BACT|nr:MULTISPECIES: hypothetical protein [Arcobacteraceae]AXX85451.1 hypothetical protein ASKIR_1681 [Aliarcobacter skirrowii CCUG 10374]AZL54516.1 hypothetical protein EI285_08015 [Aliarcobacter skirrowii]KAB0621138.1 hypothetical protein F7P70_05170 [Aliarcobacter skirrowii CCUG 10374]MCT7446377.1 hypothetical protein [Aliarcobacter skirrowii]MDD2508189.1 hypothetical protein [Aliarcobacter skirrowii]